MIKFAITGNIASGKSQIENYLQKFYPVYDADKIAHEILNTIDNFYNLDVFTNGKIDRKKLGNLVFNDKDLKTKLEKLIHPRVKQKILEIFEKHNDSKAVFISVPLLFEANFENLFDKIIFVSAPEEIRLMRLMKRNNLNEQDAKLRIKAQDSEADKINKSDIIICNDSDLQSLHIQIDNKVLKFL